ncbi:MAG: heme lyase CcmF/NrfE family subunit, partial [Actinomycetota bacterium]
LSAVPLDGRGPLPLLQNHPLMAVHPPMLYLGFTGFTVPFAFAIAALITGRLSDRWIRITRRWTLAAWVFLTLGLVLGGLWSYGVLGWGGYWAWDPVENVALLPWLTATAFLHSVIIEERRGMLKVWNLSLIVGTFALATLATFLTRGSILSSVHAFAQSIVGPMYLGFLVIVLVLGFGLIALRSDALRTEGRLDSALSREGAFLGNNLVLLAFTFTVLVGTLYPLLEEALSGRQVSVGAPYFRSSTLPLALLLLLLAGAAPLVSWRMSRWGDVRRRLRHPAWAAGAVIVSLAAAGIRNPAAILGLSLAAFVAVANASEFVRGVRAFRRSNGGSVGRAAAGAVARNRRLYGGLIVHLGVALAAMAITTSSSFVRVADVRLAAGETTTFQGYELRFEGSRQIEEPQRTVVVADLAVSRGGEPAGRLTPSLNLDPSSTQPIGTPSIRIGPLWDLYASVTAFEEGGSTARFRLFLNPGVVWLWVGGAVIAIGGIVAAWPGRLAPVRVPPVRQVEPEEVPVG